VFIGLLIGIVTGVLQFLLLFKFVTSVTGGKFGSKTVMFAITQFLFPFAVLVVCAFLISDSLMWVGIGIASALIICAVVKFVFASKLGKSNNKKTDNKSEKKQKTKPDNKSKKKSEKKN